MSPGLLIEARELRKAFGAGAGRVQVLKGIDINVGSGEFLGIKGPSGAGKTTLLSILGCLDAPGSGSYRFDGEDVGALTDRSRSRLRAGKLGFVFQTYNLIPRFSVLQNVLLPFHYRDEPHGEAVAKARRALAQLGVAGHERKRPGDLSGGEMQRVAIARAIAGEPLLLLADEPTGNLDSRTGAQVLDLMEEINRAGTTVVVVTHSDVVAGRCGRLCVLEDGRFTETAAVR